MGRLFWRISEAPIAAAFLLPNFKKKLLMPRTFRLLLALLTFSVSIHLYAQGTPPPARNTFYPASDPRIRYTGRIDFSNPLEPRFWAPGVYIRIRFEGPDCTIYLRDEVLYGNNHNYAEVALDGEKPYRVQMKGPLDTLTVETGASKGDGGKSGRHDSHILTICKDTESGIGYLAFGGLRCGRLLTPPPAPRRKIEFIGNSITCGTGSDLSVVLCGQGQWYDQHNAYLSYGPTTARLLDADWSLSSVSGIGLIHSCCNMTITMPQVFDKVNMRSDTIPWDFRSYRPDVVTVCLGQNDGVQDSTVFCSAYVAFIHTLREHYPGADILCLTSPMAEAGLRSVMRRYLGGIIAEMERQGDRKVYDYFFSGWYHHGCGGHPDLEEHKAIAGELSACIKKITGW
jgi:hypothetical protein